MSRASRTRARAKHHAGYEPWDRERAQHLDALLDSVRAETRAAVLADEERRAWMERYAISHELWGSEAARVAADRFLDRWREARAAWEARDG